MNINQKLQEINKRVADRVGVPLHTEDSYATIKDVFNKAIEAKDSLSDELQTILDSGYLDRKEYKVDEDKAKIFDQELTKEINQAIRSGELPNPRTIKDPFITKMRKLWRPKKK
jgi:ArsR family metal-binding transcriptional regulator